MIVGIDNDSSNFCGIFGWEPNPDWAIYEKTGSQSLPLMTRSSELMVSVDLHGIILPIIAVCLVVQQS